MGILLYVVIGIIWASFAVYMQKRTYGDKHLELTFVLNAAAWWLCMIIAAAKAVSKWVRD